MAEIEIKIDSDIGQKWTISDSSNKVISTDYGPAIVRNLAADDYTIDWTNVPTYLRGAFAAGPHTLGPADAIELTSPTYTGGQSPITAVWAHDGGLKIVKDQIGAESVNPGWDGTKIKAWGSRNEMVAFNVIIECEISEATGVAVSFNRLDEAGAGTDFIETPTPRTPDEQLYDYTTGDIELFFTRYLELKGLSTLGMEGFVYDERHVPVPLQRPWTGEGTADPGTLWEDRPNANKFYPVILPPLELHPTFTIPAGENQGIWCDIYIPKGTTPGTYDGNLTITQAGGHAPIVVPVELTVRNIELPDVPSARTMLFLSGYNVNFRHHGVEYPQDPGVLAASIVTRDRYVSMLHRHKMSVMGDEDNFLTIPDYWIPRLDGTLFSTANGYRGPGLDVGNKVYSIGTYGEWKHGWNGGAEPVTATPMWAPSDAWVTYFEAFNAANPGNEVDYFLYLLDEPSTLARRQDVELWAGFVKSNPGVGKDLQTLTTITYNHEADCPSVDIICSATAIRPPTEMENGFNAVTANPNQQAWMYNGQRILTGTMNPEDDGVGHGVTAWVQMKLGYGLHFWWESTSWVNLANAPLQLDVFEQMATFGVYLEDHPEWGRYGANLTNGDGTSLFPGKDTALFPHESYNLDGPLASVALKGWRRGIQDADYITMARAVNQSAADAIVDALIPSVMWEQGVTDPGDPTYVLTDINRSTDPADWDSARAALADIIEGI